MHTRDDADKAKKDLIDRFVQCYVVWYLLSIDTIPNLVRGVALLCLFSYHSLIYLTKLLFPFAYYVVSLLLVYSPYYWHRHHREMEAVRREYESKIAEVNAQAAKTRDRTIRAIADRVGESN